MHLRTDRMLLRRPVAADLDGVAALHADPAVMRFIDNGRPVPFDVVRDQDMAWLTVDHGTGRGYWIAVDDERRMVGWFGLRPAVDHQNVLELGYRLRSDAWGQGLATEGARALVKHAFVAAGAVRVTATTMTVNVASRRVMEKAGLTYQRTFFEQWPEPIAGSELGDVDYAVALDEWLDRQHPL